MSQVIESKSYTWSLAKENCNVVCYTRGDEYQLHLTITDKTGTEIQTTHKSRWNKLGDKLDLIIDALSNSSDDMEQWNRIFYDLNAKFGIDRINVNSPLFVRFYTNKRNKDFDAICDAIPPLERFNINSEIWLTCDTNMNTKIVMLRVTDIGTVNTPFDYEAESSGDYFCYLMKQYTENALNVISNEFYKWAYDHVKQFYSQTHGKEISMILATFSHSLIRLITDYVI